MRIRGIYGAGGLIFVIGFVCMACTLPEPRWFLAMAVPVGLITAVVLHMTARDR